MGKVTYHPQRAATELAILERDVQHHAVAEVHRAHLAVLEVEREEGALVDLQAAEDVQGLAITVCDVEYGSGCATISPLATLSCCR